jgi:hypothetical protein
LKRPDIFAPKESLHRQTNKVKILAAIRLPVWSYGHFSELSTFGEVYMKKSNYEILTCNFAHG